MSIINEISKLIGIPNFILYSNEKSNEPVSLLLKRTQNTTYLNVFNGYNIDNLTLYFKKDTKVSKINLRHKVINKSNIYILNVPLLISYDKTKLLDKLSKLNFNELVKIEFVTNLDISSKPISEGIPINILNIFYLNYNEEHEYKQYIITKSSIKNYKLNRICIETNLMSNYVRKYISVKNKSILNNDKEDKYDVGF